MLFWGLSVALATLALLPVLGALLRPDGDAEDDRHEIAIYRDQLGEVDRDVARGVLGQDEAARIRLEVQRRLLDADRASHRRLGRAPAALNGAAAAVAAVVVVGGTVGLYLWQGAPGYPDLPFAARLAQAEQARADRPAQTEAEVEFATAPPSSRGTNPDFLRLMEQLRATVEERPDDVQGQRLLARNEAAMGNYAAARIAQARVIELEGPDADAEAFSTLAELMILAAGGFVTNEAEAVVDRALEIDPEAGSARYYKGLAQAQIGRADLAFGIWRDLLEGSETDAPWSEAIRSQIATIAQQAGIRYTPPAPQGPDADAVANAAEMDPEDRQQMIEGMVEGLAGRLATEGGPPEDWARLITAYGVLGRTERAGAIWTEAREVFSDSDAAIATIREAARQAGLSE